MSASVNDVIASGEIANANGVIENANGENANDALGAGKKAGLAGACGAAGSGRPERA